MMTLRELRLARGLKQIDVARVTRIPRETISKFETMALGPDSDQIATICRELDYDPALLIVAPHREPGGQAREHSNLLAIFRKPPPLIERPEWTSACRLKELRYSLPGFMATMDDRLDQWQPFLQEAPSEERDETILQLTELRRGAGITEVSTDWMGFTAWPVCDHKGRGASHYRRPALITKNYVMVFQVSVLTPKRYRMDGLILVTRPHRAHINLEVDGGMRNVARDLERATALALPSLRIPSSDLLNGPSLTERLQRMGFCC